MEYEERENEKEDYRTDPAFFRKGSGWNDVDIYSGCFRLILQLMWD